MKAEQKRLVQLILLVAVVLGIGTLVWWSELRQSRVVDERAEVVLPTPSCNPRGIFCLARGKPWSLSLEIDRDASYLSPFSVRVKLFGFARGEVQSVRVRFSMADMYMGENRVVLTPVAGGSEWTGSAVLPVCLTGRRDWLATVVVEGAERVVSADFPFAIDAP